MLLCFCYQNEFRDLCIVSSSLFQVNYFGISGCFWPLEPHTLIVFPCPFLCLAGWDSLDGVLLALCSVGA